MTETIIRPSEKQIIQYQRHGLARIDIGKACSSMFFDSNLDSSYEQMDKGFIDLTALTEIEDPFYYWGKASGVNRVSNARVLVASGVAVNNVPSNFGREVYYFDGKGKVKGINFEISIPKLGFENGLILNAVYDCGN